MTKNSRELLIDAAQKSLIEYGNSQTSVKLIARIAGVNHGLVHHYFHSKEELFIEVLKINTHVLVNKLNQINDVTDYQQLLSVIVNPDFTVMSEVIQLAKKMPGLRQHLQERLKLMRNIIGSHLNVHGEKKQRILVSGILGLVIHSNIEDGIDVNDSIVQLIEALKG